MKCEICGEYEAIVHIQQIIGEDVYDLHMCESCAKERGISSQSDKIELTLSEILTGLLETTDLTDDQLPASDCSNCGMKYKEFRKEGKFGCIECFNAFRTEVKMMLKNMYGKVRHSGKYPTKLLMYKTLLIDKEEIRKKLDQAVKKEDYEEAACLRDRMMEIERASGEIDV